MDLQACTTAIRAKVGEDSGLNASLKFDCGDDGVVFVNALAVPNTVSNEQLDAACTVTLALTDLGALLSGQLNPVNGFMMGKLKVAGDMSVAMRLQKVV
ncbi:SCP2 sterol-binding domain-containing protein [Undibacterium sp. Jales W-56]|uniref:SCP2 sterol-binding domain-containing protein n=1 Tax=Undibacterium sp. Jales W-56 TaxID=2897325 RepID=UPI0021D2148D|nr:SCP2 sterol-binding domain-containing protein [Undibacterium sp. Jales W-56]MCU6433553.1 SCP2 sterol-binding domain-containing protein [Undibacterium sp. Jales W-56]